MPRKKNTRTPDFFIKKLIKKYPGVKCALTYDSVFQLLVATVLSAQCTDERVNKVTPVLFKKLRTPEDFMKVRLSVLENLIRSTGFFRQKAKNIKKTAEIIHQKYGGKVPKHIDDLIQLPGVARKTANVVLTEGYGIVEGIAVDTHVKRLAGRLGITKFTDPVRIEKDLLKKISKPYWGKITLTLIHHGRLVCQARSPKCDQCFLEKDCPSVQVKIKK